MIAPECACDWDLIGAADCHGCWLPRMVLVACIGVQLSAPDLSRARGTHGARRAVWKACATIRAADEQGNGCIGRSEGFTLFTGRWPAVGGIHRIVRKSCVEKASVVLCAEQLCAELLCEELLRAVCCVMCAELRCAVCCVQGGWVQSCCVLCAVCCVQGCCVPCAVYRAAVYCVRSAAVCCVLCAVCCVQSCCVLCAQSCCVLCAVRCVQSCCVQRFGVL